MSSSSSRVLRSHAPRHGAALAKSPFPARQRAPLTEWCARPHVRLPAGPQLPPIAPLVLMDTAVLDADWSTALRPATHATLHALVTGHKALREACGAAAATATASEAEAAAAGGATDGGLPHTQLPAAPAVALEVGGGSAAMVGEGTAQRQVVQAVQQQCCPAPRPCLAPVATNANTATHSATSKGSRSSSGSPRFPIGAGVPHLVGVVGVPQPQHPQL